MSTSRLILFLAAPLLLIGCWNEPTQPTPAPILRVPVRVIYDRHVDRYDSVFVSIDNGRELYLQPFQAAFYDSLRTGAHIAQLFYKTHSSGDRRLLTTKTINVTAPGTLCRWD